MWDLAKGLMEFTLVLTRLFEGVIKDEVFQYPLFVTGFLNSLIDIQSLKTTR